MKSADNCHALSRLDFSLEQGWLTKKRVPRVLATFDSQLATQEIVRFPTRRMQRARRGDDERERERGRAEIKVFVHGRSRALRFDDSAARCTCSVHIQRG